MKVLKILASTLLSMMLFLCLIVAGAAITVNGTLLNAGFVTKQIDKLDVVALFNEEALPQLQKESELAAHPEVIDSIQRAVTHNVPVLKKAINTAVSNTYGYLLHGETFDLSRTLKKSVFDPQLAISILSDIDISTIIHNLLTENVPLASAEIAGINVDLTPYTDSIVAVIQPWFKEQFALLIPGLYDFILGDNSTLDLSIPVGSIVTDIGSSLKSAILASPPPALASLSQAQLSPAIDASWALTAPQIPDALTLTSSEIGFEQPTEIRHGLDDAQRTLVEVRGWIVYYQEAFWGLVGLMLVLVLGIIFINRDVKVNCRILGGTFTMHGLIEIAGILLLRNLFHTRLPSLADLPQSILPWLLQLSDEAMNPLLIFAVFCAVLGVILLVISFLWHRKRERPASI